MLLNHISKEEVLNTEAGGNTSPPAVIDTNPKFLLTMTTFNNAIFKSENGLEFEKINTSNNLSLQNTSFGDIRKIKVINNKIFLFTNSTLLFYFNKVEDLVKPNGVVGIANLPFDLFDLIFHNGIYIAAGYYGVYVSSDLVTWIKKKNYYAAVYSIAIDPIRNIVIVGCTQGYFFYSTDNGNTWTQSQNNIYVGTWGVIYDIAFCDGMFVAVGDQGAVGVSFNGIEWFPRTLGATDGSHANYCVSYIDKKIIVGGFNSLYAIFDNSNPITYGDFGRLVWKPQTMGGFSNKGTIACIVDDKEDNIYFLGNSWSNYSIYNKTTKNIFPAKGVVTNNIKDYNGNTLMINGNTNLGFNSLICLK